MLDNDKTPANLLNLSKDKLKEDAGDRMATFELLIDRRPKADPAGPPPFTGADTDEGNARLVLGYTGTATHGTDYNNPPLAINIPKSGAALPDGCSASDEAVTCTVTLKVTDDKLYEGGAGTTESVKIDLNAEGSSFNDGIKRATEYESLDLTIEDNDLQPMLAVGDVTATEGSKLTFDVTRTGAMENKLSVQATTADDNDGTNRADAGSDYTAREKTTLNFAKNTLTQTFEVTTIQDVIDEQDETFLVKLSDAKDTGGEPKPAIKTGIATGTIKDNDDAPTALTVTVDTDAGTNGAQDTIAEAAGETPVRVTATITSSTRFATQQTVTITVGKEDDTAVEGTDYGEVADDTITITIPATQASGTDTFELTPVNDDIDDDGEKISVEGALAGMTVTHDAITIEDDDTRGITVSKATLTIDEADDTNTGIKEDEGTYEVALTSQPEGGTVTINITNPGPTVATAEPSNLMFTADNWESAQVVTMIAKDDTIDDAGDQKTTTITHTVSADGTDYEDEEVDDVTVTVLDDDEAPAALTITVDTDTDTDDDQNTISEGAATPTVRITTTLDGDTQFATDKTITITVGDSDNDTATEGEGGDYDTVNDFNITLPAGKESVSHDLPLTLTSNDGDEPDESVTVTGELAGVTVKGTTITIKDNDPTPTVTLVLTPASINESGATNASTVTATMDGKSSEAVTLTVSATPIIPAVAGDLTLSENTTLTIPAKSQASTGVVTITAVDNKVDAADKTVTIAASATGGNGLVQAPEYKTLTITDDDTRGITVSKATLTLDEEDNAATMEADEHQGTYTVVLDSEPSGGTVTIGVASGDTTIAGVAPATLTFNDSDWDEPQTVTVTAVPDVIDNPNDRRTAAITHTVTATGTDYDGATASGVEVTVNDDDGAPTLSINSPSVTEVDSGATATLTFTVRLAPYSGNTVTVDYADAGTGTATSRGTDYETLAGSMLNFDPGDTSKTFEVTVTGDNIDEPDETVVVRLSSPSNATLTGGATTLDGTGTINDNDPTPTVSVADAMAVSEGDVGSPDPPNNMTFTVTLSADSGQTVTVPYTLSGTATAGTDYTEPDPRSVMIAAGDTQAMIEIPVAGDEVDEENETITVTLGTPTNATVSTEEGAGAASGTITDDDTRGVSVTPTALTVAEADNTGTAGSREDQETYEVVLTSQPTGAVTVNLKSGDESVARINTASLVFDADDWNTERTVTVTGQADVIDNGNDRRQVDISHTVSAAGTDYASETAEDVAVTVTDDDAAPSGITLTANPDSVTESGGAKTITVTAAVNGATRYAEAKTVSVSAGGGTAISGTDYTAVESFDITIGAGEDDASKTFTLTPENDVLAEGNETIDVTGTLSGVTITPDEITLTDDDAAPSGITLSVDTNGATEGTPNTVAEDAGATVVTVTATVNGTTRYVDAKTVAVSVADDTAASPADYAAVPSFNITIAAGAASHTGSFTVTPVDDSLDEANETINVTGTLTDIDITGATVTFTDNDDPVSFSIADAEATEGGKVTFTVSRAGAGNNVASVKVTTATDSGDGVNAADADDYTAIATAQTLNFAKGVPSQTVEVQTTQDDLFEPDETFKAVLSAPALGQNDPGTGVSIAGGKGTATGTIKNDDTQPSFAVADASATEGDAITFTVTRSGAMDNAVSVKWNTKETTGDGAASATDYTEMTAARTLSFAKDVGTQTFTVATTEDTLHEGDETFLVELTEPVGAIISDAEATGTITDDDAAPTGITLTVSPATVGEEDGKTKITVTATVNGTTRYVDAKTVTVSLGGGTATSATDYAAVPNFDITIDAGDASKTGTFDLTPTNDDLYEGSETIDVTGISNALTITKASITLEDDDAQPSFAVADASASEGDVITFTVTRSGAMDNAVSVKWNTKAATGAGAASASDYTAQATATKLDFAKGVGSQTFTVATTEDTLNEANETFLVELTEPVGATITDAEATGTITNDDAAPTTLTLAVDADYNTENVQSSLAENGGAKTVKVTATLGGSTQFDADKTLTLIVGDDDDSATEGTDYTDVADQTITITAGDQDVEHTFTLTPTDDAFRENSETISFDATLASVTVIGASITLTSEDAAPAITLTVDADKDTDNLQTSLAENGGDKTVRVTATLDGTTRLEEAADLTLAVGKDGDSAVEGTDYTTVADRTITIGAEADSVIHDFTLTPTNDDLYEGSETISLDGTLNGVAVTDTLLTLTDDDTKPSFAVTDASASEGDAITFTVTRSGAMDNAVSVKWNTKADSSDGANAASAGDYTEMTTATKLDFAKGVSSQTFTVATTEDTLHEGNETFLVELTEPVGGTITTAEATGTITDDDDAPSGITLSVDTNGSTSGTPSTVAEDAGATVVTVTATVNGETRYVDAKTVEVSVADGTATSPADYAEVSNFDITIAAGAASHTGSFTVTPVDDDLDEPGETIDVTGTLTDITITDATVTITDNDDPVSFSITDAEATEGGKITFTVSREGAADNVASVKVATAADSGDGVNAADADDYTAIATAQTLNFAKGVPSQTVEVQTTQDDLFEPDETFKAVLSAPALGQNDPGTGVSIAGGKGTATGTIKNDDTQPSFAVADASASEGDAITFTVTRSGAMDNAVSVKWNTKADSSDGANAASAGDYTEMTTATKLDFAKGVSSQTFTVATTEDSLHEGNETFLVELTEPVGGTITTAEATGTITDDDDAPSGITLSVDTNGSTSGTPSTVAEDAGATVVTVTATVNGETRYVDAKTVEVSVADGTATSPADYAEVSNFDITIAAGAASHTGSFTVTPVDDDLDEPGETIDVTGTLTDITITDATVTITDNDDPVSFSITDAEATEGGKITFTVSREGAADNVASVKVATAADSGDGVNAADADDYTAIATAQTLNFAKGVPSQTVEVQTTQDDLFEPDETFKAVLSDPALAGGDPGTGVSIAGGKGTATGTIKNDDTQPSFAVADASASEGDDITFTVTRSGAMDNAVSVKWNTKPATGDGANAASASDYTPETTAQTLSFAKGVGTQTFTVATTEDSLHEGNETFLVELTDAVGGTISTAEATGTITDDDAAPTVLTLTVDADTGTDGTQTSLAEDGGMKTVRVTATLDGSSTFTEAKMVTVEVGAGTDAAEEGTDYAEVTTRSITINAGSSSGYVDFPLTPTNDDIDEPSEDISIEGTLTGLAVTGTSLTLTDDEDTPTVTLVLTPTTINESGATTASTVTATLSGESSVAVTLTVAAAAGANTAAGDFTLSAANTLTIAAGATASTGAVTITAVDNDVDAPNKSVTVSATASGGGVASPADQTLTINDDEGVPTATLVLTPTTINESGATTASTVTATLSGESSVAVTLTVAAAAGANTVAGDFTLSATTTLTIAVGATTSTGTVTITAVDNNMDASNKSVTVSATASGGGVSGVANPDSQTLTITDDDDVAPTVTLVLTPATINESGSTNTSTVTATLLGKSSAAVTLTVAAAAGAHTVAGDFTVSTNKTLTIAAGAKTSTGAVTITAVDNDVDAPNKSVTVSATASGGGVADPGNQTLTITDDDVAPTGITLSVSPATVGEGDDETEITVTATVNGTTRYVDAKTVTVSVGGGDAISGTDYTAVPSFDIIIAAGEASKAGTFDLTPTDDVVHEGTEKIDINGTLSGVTITKATITLTDDDAAPTALTLSVDADMGTPGAQTSLEEDGGAKKVRVTATLDGRSAFTETKTVTLEVGADADSATEGTDYAEVERQSITINAGAESGYVEFTLAPTQDVLHEGSEAISLDGTLTGVTVTDSKIMLNDDDGAPTALTLSVDADMGTPGAQTSLEEDGGAKKVRVTATLDGRSAFTETKTVTLEVGADADSATEGTDYAEVMRRSVTINAGAASGYEEFTLTPTDDTRHEGSETISLEGTLTDVAVTGTSITITDEEDTPTVTLMLAPTTISESGSTNTSTVTATLSGESSSAVTVTVAAAAGAGTAAGDFTVSTNKTLTIAAGATTSTGAVTITAVDNNVDAPNKSVTVSATASGGGVASPADQTLVITDDDAAPTGITLSVSPATVGEGDGETEITVTATVNGSTRYVDAKTVTVSVGGGTAISGTDYAAVPSFDITIAAGDASKAGTFDLEPTDDAVHEENETIDVTGSSGSLTITKASITITDNDDRSDPMLAAWLGRFGRGVAEQALDGIAGRIAASRSAGMQGTVAGKALVLDNPGPTPWNFGAGRSFGYAARSDPTISFDADSGSNPSDPVAMTAREVLLGSSFTATGETATGGSLALWGRTAQSSFDGQDGAFSLDGETTSAMLGADYARDGWLLGLALMHSSGKGGYSDTQARPCPAGTVGQSPCSEAVRTGGGTVKATMTAVLPYASLQVSERLRLWGALGHGSGEVTLMPEPGGTLSADISWSMAATGLRGDVITAGQGSNFSLAFTSDMLWSRTRSEKTHELAASSATVTRLRAGLEAGWQMPLEHGSWLTPRLEIGARHDGGDAETGLGVELGGGLAWTDPGRGLSLDLSARTLIVHDDDDIKDQGFAAAFSFDPQPDSARGLSLSLRQDAGGQPEGGLNALFTPEPLSAQRRLRLQPQRRGRLRVAGPFRPLHLHPACRAEPGRRVARLQVRLAVDPRGDSCTGFVHWPCCDAT